MNVNQTETIKSPPSIKSTLIHLEDVVTGRDDRALCGAKVRESLPATTQLDCVVCAEMANKMGYRV